MNLSDCKISTCIVWYIGILKATIMLLLFLPLIMYYGWKYHQNRNNVAFKHRYAFITIIEIVLTIIGLTVNSAYMPMSSDPFDHELTLWFLISIIGTSISALLVSCWIWRFWMIYFNMKCTISMLNKKWMHIINANSIGSNTTWYLNNRNKFGNSSWIFYRFFVPWNIIWLANSVSTFFIPVSLLVYQFLIWFICYRFVSLLILCIIYCKLPLFNDIFFVFVELKILIVIYLLKVISTVPVDISGFVLDYLGKYVTVALVIWNFFVGACDTAAIMVSTYWVLNKLNKFSLVKNSRTNVPAAHALILLKSVNNDCFHSIQSIQLKQILGNEEAFHVYIAHLSKEFSMHFALAFIEIIQIQKFIMKQNAYADNVALGHESFSESLFQTIRLYDNIPKSQIVFCDDNERKYIDDDDDDLQEIKRKCDTLYKRYIENGAEYEIMLSNKVHDEISDVMSHLDWIEDDDIDINKIQALWDSVSKELFILLLDGFGRFQCTIPYRNLNLKLLYIEI